MAPKAETPSRLRAPMMHPASSTPPVDTDYGSGSDGVTDYTDGNTDYDPSNDSDDDSDNDGDSGYDGDDNDGDDADDD